MTTQKRLRLAADEARKQRPMPMTHGQYLHELLDLAADEMDRLLLMFAELALAARPDAAAEEAP